MSRATVASEGGVQIAVWLLLTLLLIIIHRLRALLPRHDEYHRVGNLWLGSRCSAVACGGEHPLIIWSEGRNEIGRARLLPSQKRQRLATGKTAVNSEW